MYARRCSFWFVLITLIVIPTITWADSPSKPSSKDVEFFEKKIRPLLVSHCYRCHSSQTKRIKGGLRLDSRAQLLKGGDSGIAVVPGKPMESLLLKAVHYADESLQMPPKGKLKDREILLLTKWIQRGAPFPGGSKNVTEKNSIDWKQARQFWSFRPLQKSSLPNVRHPEWAERRLDYFVQSRLEEEKLAPSKRANRRTLIRRVSFDLIGLPPTPEEVQRFVQDDSPDAYPRMIDRLLASPHYGERWARFWLDLARYCDVAESWSPCKGQAFHYRDWVVNALNADVPYDQFVIHQLAADLLPNPKPGDHAALGFLGRSPDYWKELKLAPGVIKTIVAEEWEERIDTVGRTFLGLTIACARCHDHKFDPITQKDYYALAGVFANTRLIDRPMISKDLLAQFRKKNPKAKPPMVPAVEDSTLHVLPNGAHRTKLVYKPNAPRDVAVQIRGNPTNPGSVVPRRFLTVLSSKALKPFVHGSGRRELAESIVGEGSPLAARVIVNRIWQHHFGRGLVDTPSNFGSQGARPSHPKLLDDLAAGFVENEWSIKWLHREILLSATYQQVSDHDADRHAKDPENRYLWRMNRRRLEVEAWRDAMLSVTGSLDQKMGGTPLALEDVKNHRRTIYGIVKRREISAILRLHDFPDPTAHSAQRIPTTTPLQQLFTLNSPFLQSQASAFVQRLKTDAGDNVKRRIRHAHQLLYGREPSPEEMRLALDFVGEGDANWEQYAQVLLGSNELLFVD